MKTGTQIQSDIVDLLRGSALLETLSGGMYRAGMRPRDSRAEDLVVIFTTGTGNVLQEGVVTLNIYVPDIAVEPDGVLVPDSGRCQDLEAMALNEIDTWNAKSPYHFSLRNTIYTMHDDAIEQSFIAVLLRFRVLDV